MPWNPAQYSRYAALRLRPAADLLAAVPAAELKTAVDLGCGTGNVTRLIAGRWPSARVTGVDSSAEMLSRARATLPEVEWVAADIATWSPGAPVDLLFSNAALHWLPDHDQLFARLVGCVRPGGVLAVQMPRNWEAPSHRLLEEIASERPWRERLAGVARPHSLPPGHYHSLLAGRFESVDIWETIYLQQLEGADAVFEWVKGTALVPFQDALGAEERLRFEAMYRERLARAYPGIGNGTTLYPFRRLFIVARR